MLLVSVDAVRGIGFRVTVCHLGSLTDVIGRPAPNIEIISSTNKKFPDRFDLIFFLVFIRLKSKLRVAH